MADVFFPSDGRIVEDVSAESGSPNITSATGNFKDRDVGASVTLYNSTDYLLTSIVAIISATSIALADAVPADGTNLKMVFGHDQSQAVEDAINALDSGNGGTLQFEPGIVILSRPLQDPTGRNCVVRVPNRITGKMNQITLRGTGSPAIEDNGFLNYKPSLSGTVIFCPTRASGTNPSIFNGSYSENGQPTLIDFRLESLTIRRARGSLLGEFNFRNGGGLSFDRCVIQPDYGLLSEWLAQGYTSLDHTSIIFPNSNNGGSVRFSGGRISGAGYAIKGSQHLVIDNTTIAACNRAVAFDAAGNGGEITVTNSHLVGCRINFYVPDGIPVGCWNIDGTAVENSFVAPLVNEWDFFDETGLLSTGRACLVALVNPVKTNTNNVAITTRGFTQCVRNPQPFVLSGNQRLALRQADDGSFAGVEIQRPDGSFFGLILADSSTNQLIYQSGPGVTLVIRNNDLHGMIVRNGSVCLTDGLGVGNSAAATTPGNIVRKTEIFDVNGNLIGFVPIYDAIT